MSERVVRRRRGVRRLAGLLIVVALAVSACGVPSHSSPIVDPNLPTNSDQAGSGGVPPLLQSDRFIGDPVNFIENGYLMAVASQIGAAQQIKAVKQFLAPGYNLSVPSTGSDTTASLPVTVVRVVNATSPGQDQFGETPVRLDVQEVGSFDPNTGIMTGQAPTSAPVPLDFMLDAVGPGPRYQVAKAPQGLFMLDSAFSVSDYYHPQVIYFSTANGQLVPDLRYLETWLSPQQQATYVVNWLLAGPPAWMASGTMKPFVPAGIQKQEPAITMDDSAFVVNLQATTLTAAQMDAFVAQVQWSLGTINAGGSDEAQAVELQIANRTVRRPDTSSAYIQHNQAALAVGSPIVYGVVAGKVEAIGYVPLAVNPKITFIDPAPSGSTKTAFESTDNADVVFGAVHATAPDQADVALVRSIAGKEQLWVTRPDGGAAKYVRLKLPVGMPKTVTFTRPVWLDQAPGYFAVVADGDLYVVNPKNQLIPVATNATAIQGFSIGQDGYHIAYVSGHQLWTAMLTVAGGPTMTPPSPVNLSGPNLDAVDSVAWSSISTLVVAGTKSGGGQTIEVNCDGNGLTTLTAYPRPTTPQIVSYPEPPQSPEATSPVMVQRPDGAYIGRANLVKLSEGKDPLPNNPFFAE